MFYSCSALGHPIFALQNMSNKLTSNAPIIAIIVTTLVWTITWVVSKHAMQYMGPFDFAAWRFGLGTLTLFVVLLIRRAPLKPTPFKLTFAIGMTQTAAFQALAQWALVSGGAGRVSMLVYTMPFWAVLFAWGLLRERPSPRQWLGIAVAVVGLVLVIEPWHDLGGWQSTSLAIAGGAFWALGTVLTKQLFQLHHPDPLALTFWSMFWGSLVLVALALLVPSRPVDWTPALVLDVLYVAVLASSLAFLLWSFVIMHLSAGVASLSSLGVPIGAILLAWAWLHERPDAAEMVGVVLISLGLLATSSVGTRAARLKPQAQAPAAGTGADS